MHGVAREMFSAYEKADMADIVKLRQLLAGGAQLAQAYGDKLSDSHFDAPGGVSQ